VVRQTLLSLLTRERGFLTDVAAHPLIAMKKMGTVRPDVIVLDLHLPHMDGLTFLRELMAEAPIPVVVCSAHTSDRAAVMQALEAGAVDVIAKPALGVRTFLEDSAVQIEDAVRAAACARLGEAGRATAHAARLDARPADVRATPSGFVPRAGAVVALAASTGGTEALKLILEAMPVDAPPILVVQHMPAGFTQTFALRLNETCTIEVKEAQNGDVVQSGRALIAPGDQHLRLALRDGRYCAEVRSGELVRRHRPSADVLFASVARAAGPAAVGAILTGMGDDGARGLLEMRSAGAATLAQDEASSIVFGMPQQAIRHGAVEEIVPLSQIASALLRRARTSSTRTGTAPDRLI
jgi:two-component system chemotaxis response regulator CheB